MALRSRLPSNQGLTREMVQFLELLDRRVTVQSDLASTATLAEVITAFNALLAAMRTSGKMET